MATIGRLVVTLTVGAFVTVVQGAAERNLPAVTDIVYSFLAWVVVMAFPLFLIWRPR